MHEFSLFFSKLFCFYFISAYDFPPLKIRFISFHYYRAEYSAMLLLIHDEVIHKENTNTKPKRKVHGKEGNKTKQNERKHYISMILVGL